MEPTYPPLTDCILWEGALNSKGYGHLRVDGFDWLAHRYAYYKHYKKYPGKLMVLHSCDNRRCINPEHLFLGTNTDNMRDAIAKGRPIGRRGPGNPEKKHRWNHIKELFRR